MRLHLEKTLPCSASAAWNQVAQSDLLSELSGPLILFDATDEAALPDSWQQAWTIRIKCRLFGVIPLPMRTLFFERVDEQTRQIQTREHDLTVRRWDHLISIRADDNGTSLYSDSVEIEARPLTLPVYLFAKWFYRHRH